MVFLHSHGVGASRVTRVYHGIDAVQVMSELLEVPQDLARRALGFELADGTVVAGRVGEIERVTSEGGGDAGPRFQGAGHCRRPRCGQDDIVNPILRPQQFLNPGRGGRWELAWSGNSRPTARRHSNTTTTTLVPTASR